MEGQRPNDEESQGAKKMEVEYIDRSVTEEQNVDNTWKILWGQESFPLPQKCLYAGGVISREEEMGDDADEGDELAGMEGLR